MRIAVELDPPAGNAGGESLAFLRDGARTLADAGADCITMADNPRAIARGDGVALASLTGALSGVPVIPHLTCRDRNLVGMKSALLALDMAGVHDVLVVTGDPLRDEDRARGAKGVEFHSADLARFIGEWNRDPEFLSRPLTVSAALNVNAPNFAAELKRAELKAKSGVARFFTQPVLSPAALMNLGTAKRELGGEIYGGILPIVSEKNALFLANEIHGINVGEETLSRYRGADKETASALALGISLDFARAMRNDADGFYVITPFRRVDLVAKIVRALRADERACMPDALVRAS